MPEKQSNVPHPQKEQQLTRRQTSVGRRYGMVERFADEVERMFADFGIGHSRARSSATDDTVNWTPDIEVSRNNNELVVRADLPGMNKDDVTVDVTDDAITITGERRREHQEERGGVYRSERSYGSFYRTILLPEGAITDQAKASFKDGVLEIAMPAPPEQVTRGRRLEIADAGAKSK
jgi:HSP20 family protein